ncbi:MAG: GNAT family N-acetyltransferase, partial [Krumholzibacteria bacterium]|nr:GNAT family N-acetyltransferase [Candidatus Krumholzibacteria bacterium]
MQIATATAGDHAGFRALVDAEIRPDRAKTHAWDDFPLVLDPANAPWTLVARAPDGSVAAGLAALIREHTTTLGPLRVAGLGSVVTRPEFRGQGLSTALQEAMLAKLERQDVPLAVLWTDRPEIYAGRGFAAAGWEHHADLGGVSFTAAPPELAVRTYRPADAEAVAALFARHPWRTVRQPGDAARLYGMPGTRGLVAEDPAGRVIAAVFCGKGADFPGYVPEWDGPPQAVLPLLAEARQRGWAEAVLVPAGGETLLERLAALGAGWV